MKVKMSTVDIILLCLTFYEITYIPHMLFIAVKYLILFYLFAKYILAAQHMKLMLYFIVLYGGITAFSSIYHNMASNTIVASFMYLLQIIDIFIVVKNYLQKYPLHDLVAIIFKLFLIYLLVADALMIVIKYNFSNPAEEYLIGNKFTIAYLHCFVCALLFYLHGERLKKMKINGVLGRVYRIVPLLFVGFSICICIRVTCTTGLLICLFMGISMIIPSSMKDFFSDRKPIILVIVILNVLIFSSYALFTNPVITSFVMGVLGKSITWTGRLQIYKVIFDIIKGSPLIGYGYFNNMVVDVLSYGNAQNGILKIMVDSGILGLMGYAGIVYLGVKRGKSKALWAFYAFFYAMIIASMVEINLAHMIVFMNIAMIYSVQTLTEKSLMQ